MPDKKRGVVETFTIGDYEKSFGPLQKGMFIAFNDPNGDVPFGPIRQITGEKDRNGCYPVAFIVFDAQEGFQRIDRVKREGTFAVEPRLIPVTKNILPPVDETDVKEILLKQALANGTIDRRQFRRFKKSSIPAIPSQEAIVTVHI